MISIICLHSPLFSKKKCITYKAYNLVHTVLSIVNVSSVYFLKHYICHYEEMSYVFFLSTKKELLGWYQTLFKWKESNISKGNKNFNILILFLLKFGPIKKIGFYAVMRRSYKKCIFFKFSKPIFRRRKNTSCICTFTVLFSYVTLYTCIILLYVPINEIWECENKLRLQLLYTIDHPSFFFKFCYF